MKRNIIKIKEELCNGCGICVPNCHEGALQVLDGKARLISELMCDGLGACLNECPEGAISIEEKEAQAYDETKVMENMLPKGRKTILAHLRHLKEHGETVYLKMAEIFLQQNKEKLDFEVNHLIKELHEVPQQNQKKSDIHGCPGMTSKQFNSQPGASENTTSQLTHWPVQLHLINPGATQFKGADLLVAADCTAFSTGNFHAAYLKNKKLVIACPKLDNSQDIYTGKLKQMIEQSALNTISVLIMQVPCCTGLLTIVKNAVNQSNIKIPVKKIVLDIQGNEIQSEWI